MKPTKFGGLVFACLVISSVTVFAQWNRNAGINPSLNIGATTSASSENGANVATNATDNNESTRWESKKPLPSGFISSVNQNLLLGASAASNSPVSNPAKLTDGSNSGSANFSTNTNGLSFVKINLPSPSKLSLITFKANIASGAIDVMVFDTNGDSTTIGQFLSASSYSYEKFFTSKTITAIKLSSNTDFSITELGAIGPELYEDLDVDLGSTQTIAWVHLRSYTSPDADSAAIFTSTDGINWSRATKTNNDNYFTVAYRISPNVSARYVKIRTYMKIQDHGRAKIHELQVYDHGGLYGEMPASKPSNRPLKEMIGINGIWGWGTQDYSDLAGATKATNLYSRVSTHARNYHNMQWDVADPDITPDYTNMPGSLNKAWLDWDREYQTWKNAGLEIQTSIQFTTSWLPQNLWNNPYQAAYNYGYAFANHFGPTNGNGLVSRMEVGNEPWDYDSTFYKNVVYGMAKGAKAADPAIEVYSCALQSADPSTEIAAGGNFMGVRLPQNTAQYLDGLNVHHYSYINDPATGNRVATFPENPASTMRGIVSDIRFRDANMPGTKILMSEWGWDAAGAGEPCHHNECVSEEAQAMYAVRGIFMLDRLGVDRATWYFYANLPYGSSLYTRSGLTGSKNTNFAPKKAFYAIEHLLKKMGDSYFLEVIAENDNEWAYLYGDSTGRPTHLIAWKPTDANDAATSQLEVKRGFVADSAWKYDGLNNVPAQATLAKNKNGEMTVNVSSAPVLIKLDSSSTNNFAIREPKAIQNGLSIYPNPSKGSFKVKLTMNEGSTVSTTLYSLDGRTTKSLKTINTNAGATIVDFSLDGLAPGVYLFEAVSEDQSFVQRQQIVITP